MSHYKIVISDHYFNRNLVNNDLTNIYLFTENLDYTSGSNRIFPSGNKTIDSIYKGKSFPNASQAVIRGLHNAYPIITKKGKGFGEFFEDTDEDYNKLKEALNCCVRRIHNDGRKTLIVSAGGFATDRAGLPKRHANLLASVLKLELGISTRLVQHHNGKEWGLIPVENRELPTYSIKAK